MRGMKRRVGIGPETFYIYRMSAGASLSKRSKWEPWGLPGEPFDPATDEFTRWRASVAKTFSLKGFKKFGLEAEYLGGENLDRFSKYQFGYFADSRVHGYQSELVRAGLRVLEKLGDDEFNESVQSIERLKPGRR